MTDAASGKVVPVSLGSASAGGRAAPCDTVTLPVDALDRFATSFERASRRWEFIAYPALFVLVVLLAYGFFLIYSLTNDIKLIAEKFDPEMGIHMNEMATSVKSLNASILDMNAQVARMASDISVMSTHTNDMKASTAKMVGQMAYLEKMEGINHEMTAINDKMNFMTQDVGRMRYDMSVMNRNVSRPMSFMNSFMPW